MAVVDGGEEGRELPRWARRSGGPDGSGISAVASSQPPPLGVGRPHLRFAREQTAR